MLRHSSYQRILGFFLCLAALALGLTAISPSTKASTGTVTNLYNSDVHMCIDANSGNYGLDGDNIQLWYCNGNQEQTWDIETNPGVGHIESADGLCLDANSNDYPNNGDPLQLWTCNNNPEQLWYTSLADDGAYYQLRNASYPGMCIDADSTDYPNDGDQIQLWACNTNPEQLWS